MGFTNPVYDNNFADPHVIAVDDGYYAFATNGPLGNIQTLKSADLVGVGPGGRRVADAPRLDLAGEGVGARSRSTGC